MDDEKNFRSRNFDASANQRYLDLLLGQLAEARRKTDPTTQRSAAGKDHEAFSALLRASDLVEAVAGWALDHICGLSAKGLKMLPRQPHPSKSHPDYVTSRQLSDVHDHELEGGESFIRKPTDVGVRRLVLRNLVFAGAGGFPSWLREEFLEALDALEAGTTTPLLEPMKRDGAEFFKARARLTLVAFVNFRWHAFSASKEAARAFVGEQIGRDSQTLKDWERDLKESCLGSLEVHRTITFAVNAASHVCQARKLKDEGKHLSESEQSMANHKLEQYGVEALAAAVLAWQRAEGHEGGSSGLVIPPSRVEN